MGWETRNRVRLTICRPEFARRFVHVVAQTSRVARDFKHCLRFLVGSSRRLKGRTHILICHHHVPLSHYHPLAPLRLFYVYKNPFHDVCTFFYHLLSRSHRALAPTQTGRQGSGPTSSSRKRHEQHVQRCQRCQSVARQEDGKGEVSTRHIQL